MGAGLIHNEMKIDGFTAVEEPETLAVLRDRLERAVKSHPGSWFLMEHDVTDPVMRNVRYEGFSSLSGPSSGVRQFGCGDLERIGGVLVWRIKDVEDRQWIKFYFDQSFGDRLNTFNKLVAAGAGAELHYTDSSGFEFTYIESPKRESKPAEEDQRTERKRGWFR